MKRDASGKFAKAWDFESKRRVSLSLTNTAWQLLDDEAQKHRISRSEVIEHLARSFTETKNKFLNDEHKLAREVGSSFTRVHPSEQAISDCQNKASENYTQLQKTIQTQQKAIATLQRQKHELEALLENAPDAIARFDCELRYVYVNRIVEEILGITRDNLLGKRMHEVISDSIYKFWEENVSQVFGSAQGQSIEFEFETPFGLRFYQARLVPEFDPAGTPISVVVISRDLTETKQAEQQQAQLIAAQETGCKISAILESISDAFVAFDRNWCYTYVNQAATKILGKNSEELLGKHVWSEVFPELVGQIAYQNLHRALEEQVPVSWEEFGEPLYTWLEVRAYPSAEGIAVYFQDITERKQAEQKLRHSEERLRFALESAGMVAWEWNPNTGEVVRSHTARQIMGLTLEPESANEFEFFNLIHPDDLDTVLRLSREALSHKSRYCAEFRIIKPDGSLRWFLDQGKVVCSENGDVVRMSGVLQDITARKQIEEALHESQLLYQTLAEALPNLVWTLNPEGQLDYVNQQWRAALGTTIEQVNQLGWSTIVHPDDLPTSLENWAQIQAGASITEHKYRHRMADGSYRWFLARMFALRDERGQLLRLVGASTDIDQIKRTEEALRSSEERLALASQAAKVGTFEWNIQTNEILWTAEEEALYGLPPGSFQGQLENWKQALHPEDRDRTMQDVLDAVANRVDLNTEFRIIHPDGSIHWLAARGRTFYDAAAQPLRMIGMNEDISDRKKVENELRESEQRLQLAQQAGRIGTWEWNFITNYVSWSDGIWLLLGIEQNSIVPSIEAFNSFIHPEDLPSTLQGVETALAQGNEYYNEFRVIQPSGCIRWLLSKGQIIRSPDHQPERLLGVNIDITDLKQTESALAESNQTLQAIIQACPLAITGIRADGTVQIWNPAAEKIFGWSQQEVLGKFLPTVPNSRQEEFLHNLALTIQGQGLVGIETQRRKKDNTLFDVQLWTAPVNEQQAGISCVSVIADITNRKQTEAALRLSEERLHSFVSANVIGILFGDLEGGIQEANDEFLRIIGYTREDLQTGRLRWIDITPPEYLPLDEQAILEARRRGACTPYEKEYIHRDGHRVPVIVGFSLVLTGREEAVAFIMDLSTLKQTEESLRQSEERLRVALLVGKLGIWDWDIVNNCVTWSEQIYQFHGLTPEDFDGKVENFAELIHPEDRAKVWEAVRQALEEGSDYKIEFRAVQPTGVIRWLSTTGGVIFNQQGNPVRMLGATIDITERQAIEAEREQLLRQEQRSREQAEAANRVKDEFLAVLSHELRTPLNPIIGWTNLLLTRQFDSATTIRALQTIERNAKLQAQLIEDLLDVSRILQGKVRLNQAPVNLATTIESALETVRLSAEAKNIKIQTILDPRVGLINGDTNRLQQVVWNLLSNAIKFTPSGGSVQVKLQQIENSAVIVVSDTGQGISSEFLPHVFDYFRQANSSTTRQFGGLGLGLAIVRYLVELHGGTVQAESLGEGLGATFTVRLPLVSGSLLLSAENSYSAAIPRLNDLEILVVDDDKDSCEFIAFVLEEAGARVITANSAPEALAILSQHQPHLLLSDISMPNMDGYMLIQQVRTLPPERGGKMPAIALTAFAGEINCQQAIAVGFQMHLSKPIDCNHLIMAIANLI